MRRTGNSSEQLLARQRRAKAAPETDPFSVPSKLDKTRDPADATYPWTWPFLRWIAYACKPAHTVHSGTQNDPLTGGFSNIRACWTLTAVDGRGAGHRRDAKPAMQLGEAHDEVGAGDRRRDRRNRPAALGMQHVE